MKNSSTCTYLVGGASPEHTKSMLTSESQGRNLDCALAMVENSKLAWVSCDSSVSEAFVHRVTSMLRY